VDTGGNRDAARRLATARCEWWDAAKRVAATRRERWGAAISRRLPGSAAAMATPHPTVDARRRQIHPRDPLTYPREQTHATVRADWLLKKTRRC
jgi:hypothetical protein